MDPRPTLALALALALIACCDPARPAAGQSLTNPRGHDFEADAPGRIAAGFVAESGAWEVVLDGKNHVLAQTAKDPDDAFNLALLTGSEMQDSTLTVRVRAVAGEVDQGGGLVWRAKDGKNYYLARYNPLEDNFRLYRVVDGKRTQLASAKVPGDQGWHALKVTTDGERIVCALDDRPLLEARDATFPGPGKYGLWTKSDARSYFDDLTLFPDLSKGGH